MGFMDELVNMPATSLDDDHKFIDADTLQDKKGQKYRLRGFDAPEVEKLLFDKKGEYEYKMGEAGGEAFTTATARLARDQGFTNIKPIMGPDGKPLVGAYDRPIVDLFNENGESFTDRALSEGIFDVSKFTDDNQALASDIGHLRREQAALAGDTSNTVWDQARKEIEGASIEEGAKTLGFKQTADNEQQLAILNAAGAGDAYSQKTVGTRHFDRNLKNESTNPFSDSWEQGWIGVKESSWGVLNLVGDTTDSEWLEDVGTAGVQRARQSLGEYGTTTLDYKDVDGFGSAIEYLGNNVALSIPYMAATIAGTVAAPFTYGASLALPVSLYTGQVWNEMEGDNKNAAIAIGAGVAQAALDKLGLAGLVGKGIAPGKMLSDAAAALVKQGMSKEIAQKTVMDATRREIASFVGVAKDIAKQQLQAKQVFKDLSKRLTTGAVTEGSTEALQEAIGYTAAHNQDVGSGNFDFAELNQRMIAGAIAGTAIGSGFTVPGAVYNTGAWADVAYRLDNADSTTASEAGQWAEWEKQNHGKVASIDDILTETNARPSSHGATLKERAEAEKERRASQSAVDNLTERLLNTSALWQGATRNIFTPELRANSRAARKLTDMFGGGLQRVFSGSSFENAKHHRVAIYKNMVDLPENVYRILSDGARIVNPGKRGEISKKVYAALNAAVDKDGNFDPTLIPEGPHKQMILRLGNQMKSLGDKMHSDQAKHNADLGYIKNYLFKYKALNKTAVSKNRAGFQQKLQETYKMNPGEARELVQKILDDPNVGDVDEAFSVIKGGIVPGAHRKRTLALSEQEDFQEFMEQDVFANLSQAAKSAARFTAHRDYIGKDGEVINKLLDEMAQEGVPPSEVNRVAGRMQDYLDAESGNYKRPTSELGKSAQRVQKNFMMLTTLAGLPLATISSFVEAALVHKGLNQQQIFGKEGSLLTMGKEFGKAMWQGAGEVSDFATGSKERAYTPGQEKLRQLGFYDWDVGAATVTGVTETNQLSQRAYEIFFRATGLTGWTNFTRAARAAVGGDYLIDKVGIMSDHKRVGEPMTRETQEADEALRNLGIDVDRFVDVSQKLETGVDLEPEEMEFMENTMREATFNFVNDAVALPQSQNRPLIYQDPRFALFTQFQGFIATFTANHIPKLWGEYVKRGTPAMKYNAFATMTTMIMLGFASQYLKDLIKYGGENPYLDDAEYLQRGIRASGLLGTGERVIDQFFPIYESNSSGVADWAWDTSTGESPAAGTAKRLAKGAGHLWEGESQEGVKQLLKSAPIAGPFTAFNEWASTGLTGGGWDFKGDK